MNIKFEDIVIQMSFPTSKGGLKIIDTVLFGLIRLIIKRNKMLPLRQISSLKYNSAVIKKYQLELELTWTYIF